MKLTQSQLRKLIKEELEAAINEAPPGFVAADPEDYAGVHSQPRGAPSGATMQGPAVDDPGATMTGPAQFPPGTEWVEGNLATLKDIIAQYVEGEHKAMANTIVERVKGALYRLAYAAKD